MAIVITAATFEEDLFPYDGADDIERRQNDIARGELRLFSSTAIALTGVGDNQLLSFSHNLPRNWAWALLDFYARIVMVATGTNAWDACGLLQIADDNSSVNQSFRATMELFSDDVCFFTGNALEGRAFRLRPERGFTGIILPGANDAVNFTGQLFNSTTQEAAAVFECYTRWLQYDVNQAHNYAINTPIPVR